MAEKVMDIQMQDILRLDFENDFVIKQKTDETVRDIQDKADTIVSDMQSKGDEIIAKIQNLINKQKEEVME